MMSSKDMVDLMKKLAEEEEAEGERGEGKETTDGKTSCSKGDVQSSRTPIVGSRNTDSNGFVRLEIEEEDCEEEEEAADKVREKQFPFRPTERRGKQGADNAKGKEKDASKQD